MRLKSRSGSTGVKISQERVLGLIKDDTRVQSRSEFLRQGEFSHSDRALDRDVTKIQDGPSIAKNLSTIIACVMAISVSRRNLLLQSISFLVIALTGCTSVPPVVAPVEPLFDEQISWILRLEDQRKLADPTAESVVPDNELSANNSLLESPKPLLRPDLVLLATEGSPFVRRRAALALGRIGVIEGVEVLTSLLNDSEPEVRQMAAFGLGLIGDATATEALLSALNDISPIVQGRAAQALAQIGALEAAPAIGEMVKSYVTSAFEIDPEDVSYPHVDEVEAFRL